MSVGIGAPRYEENTAALVASNLGEKMDTDGQNGEKKRKSVIYASSLVLREHVLPDQ